MGKLFSSDGDSATETQKFANREGWATRTMDGAFLFSHGPDL